MTRTSVSGPAAVAHTNRGVGHSTMPLGIVGSRDGTGPLRRAALCARGRDRSTPRRLKNIDASVTACGSGLSVRGKGR